MLNTKEYYIYGVLIYIILSVFVAYTVYKAYIDEHKFSRYLLSFGIIYLMILINGVLIAIAAYDVKKGARYSLYDKLTNYSNIVICAVIIIINIIRLVILHRGDDY